MSQLKKFEKKSFLKKKPFHFSYPDKKNDEIVNKNSKNADKWTKMMLIKFDKYFGINFKNKFV
jgi:hypothetical protein